MDFKIGDVVEVKFINRQGEAIIFGEILNVNRFKIRMIIWEAPGSLSEWTEINIHKHDIISIDLKTEGDSVDYSELGIATH